MIAHLALIMDGNRRWAKKHGMPAWQGHQEGAKNVEMAMKYCLEKKISHLSLYTLSLENLQRSEIELNALFSLIQKAKERVAEFVKAGIKIKFVGDLSLLPVATKQACNFIEDQTVLGSQLICNFLLCYGGQQEILAGVNQALKQNFKHIDQQTFQSLLWSDQTPDPAIIIRTGGVHRLSNFLLFQAAYAEICFLDCLWPDLSYELLDQTVQKALGAQKNFGI